MTGNSDIWPYGYRDFDEFKKKEIDNQKQIIGLTNADQEIIQYFYHKNYDRFCPKMIVCDTVLFNHPRLISWFNDSLIVDIFNPRVTFSEQSDDVKEAVISDFISFRMKIQSLLEKNEISTSLFMIFLKKQLIDLYNEKQQYHDHNGKIFDMYYPRLIDEINYTKKDSLLFLLELYIKLVNNGNPDVIKYLQSNIISFNRENFFNYLNCPKLMVRPWNHQEEALDAWEKNGRNCVITMATATGKTIVGLAAINRLYTESLSLIESGQNDKPLKIIIMCHSINILNQWRKEVIDKFGLNLKDDHYYHPIYLKDITISFHTIQSVYRDPEAPELCGCDLLIIDEVHHLAAPEYRKALRMEAKYKLGLSATVEGKERTEHLEKDIGRIINVIDFKEARRRGVISNFDWKVIISYMNVKESEEFREITRDIIETFNVVKNESAIDTNVLFGKIYYIENLLQFFELIEKARYKGKIFDIPSSWKRLMILTQQRRRIIHRSSPKMDNAIAIAKEMGSKTKCLIFTMDIDICESISKELRLSDINTYMIHSRQAENDNKRELSEFKNAKYGVLISAKMLDEGINIPDAEIGINVASSKTELQLIQRIGRLLRLKKDKKPIFYHLIAIPQKEQIINSEDSIYFIDDLARIKSLSHKWGIDLGVSYDLSDIEMVVKGFEKEIKDVSQKMEYEGPLIVNPSKLAESMDHGIRQKLMSILKQESDRISDERWKTLVNNAHKEAGIESRYSIDYDMYWLFLFSCGRDPVSMASYLL